MNEPSNRCQLCGRGSLALTRHHLIPRSQHGRKSIRRRYRREEMLDQVAWLCRPCHKYVHAVFSEKELALHHNTLQNLLAHPEVMEFIRWIGDKPGGFVPRTYAMKRRRHD